MSLGISPLTNDCYIIIENGCQHKKYKKCLMSGKIKGGINSPPYLYDAKCKWIKKLLTTHLKGAKTKHVK